MRRTISASMGARRLRGAGRLIPLALCLAATLFLTAFLSAAQDANHVDVITVTGIIDSSVARYVERGIKAAQGDGAQCLVIELDTPGGQDTAMRQILQSELNAPVPVVVYVAPSGARAASAGALVTLAAHIAAMAPGTNIGAAHPVGLTGPITGTENEKITNDAAAYARSIAEQRGRNADWAEQAVRESVSITAQAAVATQVVDLVAEDLPDLLNAIDGISVDTAHGAWTLATSGAEIRSIPMTFLQRLLHAISDPNVAYVLLIIGILGLVAEFFHPGAIFPGVTGAIALILAFVAFGSLPVNWGGVALIVLAAALFIIDIKVAGHGLSIAGGITFVIGSLLLFTPLLPPPLGAPTIRVSLWLIVPMAAAISAFFLYVVSAAIRVRQTTVITGVEALLGATGIVKLDLAPRGTVWVKSEPWSAVADGDEVIHKGESVKVVAVEGVTLRVTKI